MAEAVVQEAVEAAKAVRPLGSTSGRGLPQIERIRLNVHANQVGAAAIISAARRTHGPLGH